MKKIFAFLFVLIFTITGCAPSDDDSSTASHPFFSSDKQQSGQMPYSFIASTGEEVRFLLYIPENFDSGKKWPLLVFLHGSGENGQNIEDLLNRTPLNYIESPEEFPFILVSPQLPSGYWIKFIDPIEELVSYLSTQLPIDSDKKYLTGLSIGGTGTWQYALRYPDSFSAIAPIAGGPASSYSDPVPEEICNLIELPIWAFHGGKDQYALSDSIAAVETLEACNAIIKFTLYPDADHPQTWEKAYADPDLYQWFLDQAK